MVGRGKAQILKEGQTSGARSLRFCRRHGINPAQYYQWLKASEEGAKQALSRNGKREAFATRGAAAARPGTDEGSDRGDHC